MPDGETTYAVDLLDRNEVTDEQLASAGKRIRKKFFLSLDAVTEQMLELALRAEKEDVRLRASSKILDEISGNRGKPELAANVSLQIVNAIPLDRTPVLEGKPGQVVEWEGASFAAPKEIKRISGNSSPAEPKLREWVGQKIERGTETGVGFSPDPVSVDVPVLPARDPSAKNK